MALALRDANHHVGEKRLRHIDWDLPDPGGGPLEEDRATRAVIVRLVEELVGSLAAAKASGPCQATFAIPANGGRTAHALTFGRAAVDGKS